MRILYCGDVVGRAGRDVVTKHVGALKKAWNLDWVVVNAENAAAGFGVTPSLCDDFFAQGVDVILTGNHAWDQKEILPYIAQQPRLLRPINYPQGTPGSGVCVLQKPGVRGNFVVIQVMGRLFMEPLDDPFACLQKTLASFDLSKPDVGAIFVDVHAESTSEKIAIGHYLDGRVSAVLGTHTHTPTADQRILPGGTAFQSDVGMCGDYDSVIGMTKESAMGRFLHKLPKPRLEAASGEGTLCATLIETHETTGRATGIWPVHIGPHLTPLLPPHLSL
ncbi:MAG: YmdB family metallophosphoesterase [Proteobacteria bacterium]|nr:YmdB family metallophosphoesterase [Pseudomonadota bacterium]